MLNIHYRLFLSPCNRRIGIRNDSPRNVTNMNLFKLLKFTTKAFKISYYSFNTRASFIKKNVHFKIVNKIVCISHPKEKKYI